MNRTVVVAALGTAQTLAWASSYYLPAILADPIADGTGVSRAVVFAIFSGSLLLSAVFGPAVGRGDRRQRGAAHLPAPYSPDLNPIEQAFAKYKALLRKA